MNILAGNMGGEPLSDPAGEVVADATPASQVPDNTAANPSGQPPEATPPAGAEGANVEQAAAQPAPQPSEHELKLTALQKQFDEGQAAYKAAQEQLKVFEELRRHPAFQEWYKQQQNPQQNPPDMRAHIDTLRDPRKYAQHIEQQVQQRLEQYHQQHIAPFLQQQQEQVQLQQRVARINEFAATTEDFWDLADKGLLKPIFEKYPNIDPQDAYDMVKSRTAAKDAVKKAHEVVQMKKDATVAKPGVGGGDKVGQVTVKSDEEAMLISARYAREGKRPPKFIFAD